VKVRALSWNLFHGRDAPPEPGLLTLRSRLLLITERGASHAQVNRDLFDEFASLLDAADWDVALLQECPPRWAERLADKCRAQPHLVPTSRNIPLLGPLQSRIAGFNPDLIASWEGGCNLTLVREPGTSAAILERRALQLTRRPERRSMAFSRLESGLCVANLHAGTDRSSAEREVLEAGRIAHEWAAGAPLLLGGDFNLRPALSPHVFSTLENDHGLVAPTGEWVIDHLLVSGATIDEPASRWEPAAREVPDPTVAGSRARPIRLSDHSPVEVAFTLPD
jgi:endonuclease/exonuclease/phosphatase family metal-dependent hydrolase